MNVTAIDIPFASNAAPEGWRIIDDAQLMNVPDPTFLVDGMIPDRGLSVLYGPSGTAKTTMVAGLQVALAAGHGWLGHAIQRHGASIYVAAEDLQGFKTRVRAAKAAIGFRLDAPIGVYTFPDVFDLRDNDQVRRFVRFVKDAEIDDLRLVVLDTFAASTPGASENSSEDMTQSVTAAQLIRSELDVAVILVHHSNAAGTRERGHSALRGSADAMLQVSPVDDLIHLECSKLRNGAPFERLSLKLTPVPSVGGCVVRLASEVLPRTGLSTAQEKVLQVLRDFGSAGASKTEWEKACADVPPRTFYRASAELVDKHRLVTQAGQRFYCQKPVALHA
ncbi:MAG: AAA family ATPase [Vicinamibacterales bacterium]